MALAFGLYTRESHIKMDCRREESTKRIFVVRRGILYRARNKGLQILLSNSQAGPGIKVKQEQEEISRNHVQAFFPGSV